MLIATALLIAAASVFVFSGTEQAPATKESASDSRNIAQSLRIEPQVVQPGGQFQVYVINGGDEVIGYGSRHRIERLGGSGWQESTTAFYGLDPGFTARAQWTETGNSDASELITVPLEAERGVYRVVKNISVGSRFAEVPQIVVQVYGEFVVE